LRTILNIRFKLSDRHVQLVKKKMTLRFNMISGDAPINTLTYVLFFAFIQFIYVSTFDIFWLVCLPSMIFVRAFTIILEHWLFLRFSNFFLRSPNEENWTKKKLKKMGLQRHQTGSRQWYLWVQLWKLSKIVEVK
jgi:hypothetical protein